MHREISDKQQKSYNIFDIFTGDSPIGIYILRDSAICFTNPQYRRILGYNNEELIGINPLSLVIPEDREVVKRNFELVVKGRQHISYQYRFLKKSGEIGWALETFTHIKYSGQPANLGYFTDISEYKKAEIALRNSEQRFRDLTESTSEMIWEIDTNGFYTYVNPRVRDVLGYEPPEIIGKVSLFDLLISPEEVRRIRDKFTSIVKAQKPFARLENINRHKNGQLIVLESSGVPFGGSNGQLAGYRGIDRDITEEKSLRENMQFYLKSITTAQEEERNRIATEIHDETIQELACLCTDIDEISMTTTGLNKRLVEQLEQLRCRVEDIVAGLRRFSHSLRPKLLDRFGLIAALDSLIEELKSEGNIRCCKKIVGKVRRISPEVELILFRIAQESLRNVKKHSKATEATLTIHFTDEMVNFNVRDNGIGFEIPKTLTDFARKQRLGLIGMQERAQLFGGNFKIVSKRGKGTTVTAEIPIFSAR